MGSSFYIFLILLTVLLIVFYFNKPHQPLMSTIPYQSTLPYSYTSTSWTPFNIWSSGSPSFQEGLQTVDVTEDLKDVSIIALKGLIEDTNNEGSTVSLGTKNYYIKMFNNFFLCVDTSNSFVVEFDAAFTTTDNVTTCTISASSVASIITVTALTKYRSKVVRTKESRRALSTEGAVYYDMMFLVDWIGDNNYV